MTVQSRTTENLNGALLNNLPYSNYWRPRLDLKNPFVRLQASIIADQVSQERGASYMPPTVEELQQGFELGPWLVYPERDLLMNGGAEEHLEPMVMDVLVVLASAHGRVVTKDRLIDEVWGGRPAADEAIGTKIAVLRNKLGDNSRDPVYIETVQKRGYRLRMPVSLPEDKAAAIRATPSRRRTRFGVAAAVLAIAVAAIVWWPPSDAIESIAVLQFRNLSDDKDRFQYVVDGFSEELVISLSQISDLKVMRGPPDPGNQTAGDIARTLNVDAVVTGSLRTDGEKLRIMAELISTDNFQIWTNRFDGGAQSVFNIQERVATAVRDEIRGETESPVRAASRPPSDEAFDKYMQGEFFLAKRDLESLELAQQLFQETIQIDPNFGPAYLRHAVTLLLLSDYHLALRDAFFEKALELARLGAAADAGIRDPIQLVQGFVHHQRGDWTEATDAFERAFRGPTPYPTAYHWHSRLLGDMGFMQDALDQAIAARTLEPGSQILNSRVAIAYLWNNDMDNARHYFDVANTMDVGAPDHHLAYSLFLIRDGRLDEARDSVKLALKMSLRDDWWVDAVIDGLAYPGDQQRLDAAYAAIETVSADETMPPYIRIALWVLFDKGDEAMAIALQQATEVGAIYELELIYLDEYDVLREHENFPQLLQALGLTDYWDSIGCRWNFDHVSCNAP